MRPLRDVPAISTNRSRGNERTATCDVLGLTRHIMIVSLRSPRPLRSPNAGAYGESGSMHELLSAPVIRKFLASGSAGGKVSGGATVEPGVVSPVTGSMTGAAVTVAASAGSTISGAMLRSSMTRWPAYSAPAAPNDPIAMANTAATVRRCGQVRGIRLADVGVSVARGGVGGGGTVTRGSASADGSMGNRSWSGVGSDPISGVDSGSDGSDMTARRYRPRTLCRCQGVTTTTVPSCAQFHIHTASS